MVEGDTGPARSNGIVGDCVVFGVSKVYAVSPGRIERIANDGVLVRM